MINKIESIPERTDTIAALIDAYIAARPGLRNKLAPSPQACYRRYLAVVKKIWGNLPAADLTPADVEALIVKIGTQKPGRANNILYALRSMCSWARGPVGHLMTDPTHRVKTYQSNKGHKPWTPEQIAFAEKNFTGMLRRAYFLARYTGQRASDIVRLGWTDVDGETLSLRQKKTGVRPVCPIFPELAVEMAAWEKRPGPFLLQDSGKNAGKPISPNQLWKVFDDFRADHAELDRAVWHGLRANAVIGLRRLACTGPQISDAIGLSVEMVERYSRHEDKKAGAHTLLRDYRERKL